MRAIGDLPSAADVIMVAIGGRRWEKSVRWHWPPVLGADGRSPNAHNVGSPFSVFFVFVFFGFVFVLYFFLGGVGGGGLLFFVGGGVRGEQFKLQDRSVFKFHCFKVHKTLGDQTKPNPKLTPTRFPNHFSHVSGVCINLRTQAALFCVLTKHQITFHTYMTLKLYPIP